MKGMNNINRAAEIIGRANLIWPPPKDPAAAAAQSLADAGLLTDDDCDLRTGSADFISTEYAVRFNDGHIGPEQGDMEAAEAYVRYVTREFPAVAGARGGVAGIVQRTVTKYATEWQNVRGRAS